MKKLIMLILIASMLGGCKVKPEVLPPVDLDNQLLVNSFKYYKALNGLCFGVVLTERTNTEGVAAQNYIVVNVDCGKIGL